MKTLSSLASAQRPKFTYVVKGRYWRFRHRLTGNRALPGQPGEPEFHRAYAELLDEIQRLRGRPDKKGAQQHTLEWLIRSYRASPEFNQCKPRTRSDYEKVCDYLAEKFGDLPYARLTRAAMIAIRDKLAATPRKANYAVQVLSILMNWAIDRSLLKENPAAGIKKLKLTGGGYKPWSEPEIEKFMAEGLPHIRLGVLLGLYTGQRLGDVVAMRRERYLGGEIEVRQLKTDELLPIGVAKKLAEALDSRPFPDAEFLLVQENGQPYASGGSFSNSLKREIRRLGMNDVLSFHGLRYAAAGRLEECGCTLGMILSITGHRSHQVGIGYATKRRNAAEAAKVLDERY